MQTQNATQAQNNPLPAENVFDERGVTVESENSVHEPGEHTEQVETAAEQENPAATAPKYRIGDKEFATQDEALAYAEETARSANAQQQWMNQMQPPPAPAPQTVTQPLQPAPVPPEFYENPSAYLAKFGQDIYDRTMAQFQRMQATQDQSNQIWNEFVGRHPELADFRAEVEQFTATNITDVRGIISTKGRPAGLDFIATKLKADWQRKSDMLKPRRELSNATTRATPTQRAPGVTPETTTKKTETFSEQINRIRKRGRRA